MFFFLMLLPATIDLYCIWLLLHVLIIEIEIASYEMAQINLILIFNSAGQKNPFLATKNKLNLELFANKTSNY